ncbi:hypothetical protein G6F57_017591 [Rhizopus arrhizus]|nr:hypothetical protein G6F57_017591 [Rhizopus arrhizus]
MACTAWRWPRSMNSVPAPATSQPITGQLRISLLATKDVARAEFRTKMSIQETWFATSSTGPVMRGSPLKTTRSPQAAINARDQDKAQQLQTEVSQASRPPTTVARTRPGSIIPANGVWALRLCSAAGITSHSASRSARHRSAGAPTPNWPARAASGVMRPSTAPGPDVTRANASISGQRRSRTHFSVRDSSSSSAVAPGAEAGNGTALAWLSTGV